MTALPAAWRQTHASLATKQAKRVAHYCWVCGCGLDKPKMCCSADYSVVLECRLRWKRGKPQLDYSSDEATT